MDFELTAEEIGTHNQWVVDVAQAAQRKLWKYIDDYLEYINDDDDLAGYSLSKGIWQRLEAALGEN
jgi:hypothetical protein